MSVVENTGKYGTGIPLSSSTMIKKDIVQRPWNPF